MLTSILSFFTVKRLILVGIISGCYILHTSYPDKQNQPIKKEWIELEKKYAEMLDPITHYKEEDPSLYWFIVSWLNTNYGTPNWQNYYQETWQEERKEKGIDCSGFARVLQDKIYGYNVRGSSQQILDRYCRKVKRKDIQKGDLLFFKAPYSKSHRIVHVGIYLENEFFVHATSKKSATQGFGVKIDHLLAKNWSQELVTIGRIKKAFKKEDD